MKRYIFVIHSSDIIRLGLETILRVDLRLDPRLLKHARDLTSFHQLDGMHCIVLSELSGQQDLELIFSLETGNKLDIIQIIDNQSVKLSDDRIKYRLNTSFSKEKVQEIFQLILNNQSESIVSKDENGELTAREIDVLKQVALGLSNKEIGDRLFISVHTVITHRKNITEKLGIKSISGLTVYAILNGIIDTNTINPEDLI